MVGTFGQTGEAAGGAATREERRDARVAGLALVASPVVWFVGALLSLVVAPSLGVFYTSTDPVTQVNAIAGQRVIWTVQSLMFFAGTLGAVFGLAFVVRRLGRTRAATLARRAVFGLVAVVVLNGVAMVLRLAAHAGVQDATEVPTLLIAAHFGWLSLVTSVVTAVTVAAVGLALLWSGLAKLTGALVAALSVLVLVALLGGGPLPPVVIYPIAALLGARLLVRGMAPAR